jgi:excisionase family DNA binding protein
MTAHGDAPSSTSGAIADVTRTTRTEHGVRESLLTAQDVADLLGVATSWVYEQSRRGRIPTVTLGRYRRYRRAAIEAWVMNLECDLAHAGNGYGNTTG